MTREDDMDPRELDQWRGYAHDLEQVLRSIAHLTADLPPPPGPSGDKLFTQDDVDRIVSARVARERHRVRE